MQAPTIHSAMSNAQWEFVLVVCMADALGRRAQLSAFSTNNIIGGKGAPAAGHPKHHPTHHDSSQPIAGSMTRRPELTEGRWDDPSSRLHIGNASWLLSNRCNRGSRAGVASKQRPRPTGSRRKTSALGVEGGHLAAGWGGREGEEEREGQ